MERMAELLAAKPEVMDRRRKSVEHPLRFDQAVDGPRGVPSRRLGNFRGEFSLTDLAYNMRHAINLVGIPALIAVSSRGYCPSHHGVSCGDGER